MSYDIQFKPSAFDALSKIPKSDRVRIAKKIDRLAENPRPRDAKKLADKEALYRIRVGSYRIVYEIRDDVLVVLVV